MNLDIVDPTQYPNWDDVLLSTPGHSFFHSSAWARVLKDSYGYTPLYFATIKNGQFSTLVPVMEVNSFITGKRGVSLPFTDYCDPIINEDVSFHDLFKQIIDFGKSRGWKYVELRGGDRYLRNQNPASVPLAPFPSKKYFGHTLDLSQGEKKIFSNLRDSTRRNIKKAQKKGVAVTILNSPDGIEEYYKLNCITRKKHGLPPQPFHFFKKTFEYIISNQTGFILLASLGDQYIAGAIFFYLGHTAIFKYGASNQRYHHLRANNSVMWEAIKWCCQNDHKNLSLGRTDLDNQGLLQFKTGWGGRQEIINYYKYEISKEAFINNSFKKKYLENRLFKNMPIALLKIAGSILYRHLG